MGTMVYSRDRLIYHAYKALTELGQTYVGARSFVSWPVAVAYALLPAAPNVWPQKCRRRVVRGSSGRWIVTQTLPPRRMLMTRPHDLGSSR